MKMRYLLIVGLILTIMTLGAVSASENVTDDGLAAEIEVDDFISEVDDSAAEILEESEGDVLGDYYNDGIVIQPKRMAVTDNLSAGVDVIDIDAIVMNLTVLNIVEAVDKIGNGGFSSTRTTNESNLLTRFCI